MPQFSYKARDQKGTLVSGIVESAGSKSAEEQLFSNGLIPISVKVVKAGEKNLSDIFQRVSSEELMVFTRQFYTLFKAGVSMNTILGTIGKQMTNKLLRDTILKIKNDVAEGATLTQAFGRHSKVFNELYISMLAAGEEAGILEQVLFELTHLIEKENEIKRSIKSATLYPKIVVGVLVIAVTVLMTFVVPKFTKFYSHYSAELPLPTQIMIGTSNFVREYWYIVILVVSAVWLLYRRYYNTRSGRLRIDQFKFKLPVFGDLVMKISNARFGHILSALYKSGLAMPRSLEVVAGVIGNDAFALEVRKIRDLIQKGITLSDAMTRQSLFPPVVIETTAVGERTGALDEMLNAVSEHYDLEVSHTIKNLTTLLEPILLVCIFGMVAMLALSIFLPIWNMSRIVTGG